MEDDESGRENAPAIATDDDTEIAEQVGELLARLPADTDPHVKTEIAISLSRLHSGPLPSPQTLEGYIRLMPDAGERILRMAEREQEMRGTDNRKILDNDRIKIVGSITVSFALVGAGVYCGVIGQPWLGGALGTSGAISGIVRALWGVKDNDRTQDDR